MAKAEKTRNGNQWTIARYHSFIKSLLRSGSRKWGPKNECLKDSFTKRKTNPKTGRLAKHFQCCECKKDFPQKDVQIDHIDPVIDPHVGFVSWDVVIERMYCEIEGFQVMCKPCHKLKTNVENEIAKRRRNAE